MSYRKPVSPLFSRIGLKLKITRQARGLTMDQVSVMMGKGFSKSMVSQTESGRNRMSIDNFVRLLRVYKLNMNEVCEFDYKVCPRCKGAGKI